MPITVEDVNDQAALYLAAMTAKDFDAAEDALITGKGLFLFLPDMSGADGKSFTYGREDFDSLLRSLQTKKNKVNANNPNKGPFKMFLIRPSKADDIDPRCR